jgi:hypothetical protein
VDESTMAHHDSLVELLRVPSLRSVYFEFSFTAALCQATANAFMEGTAVTNVEFSKCSFAAGECAGIMATGLARNTSVTHIKVLLPFDQALNSALAMALPSNSTLRDLFLAAPRRIFEDGTETDLSPFLLALGKNTGLKTLTLGRSGSVDESLSTAMQNGLVMNETLESLELKDICLFDNNADLWWRALSFLRTNKALKSFEVTLLFRVTDSCFSAFRIDIAAMLQENASLESLSIGKVNFKIKAEEYFSVVTALQDNTTLKSLNLTGATGRSSLTLTHDEDKQMAALLKKLRFGKSSRYPGE